MTQFQRFRNGKLETDWLSLGFSVACAAAVVLVCIVVSSAMTYGCARVELPGGP